YLNGILSAAEGTGDERVLRRALRAMDVMIAASKEFPDGGRTYRVWGPFTVTADSPVPRPSLHFTFQAAVPFARAAAVIRAHPRFRTRHEDAARRYVEFADQLVIGYFYRRQLRASIPWLDPDRFPIWNDNASNLGLTAAYLCQAGGDPEHCRIARTIGLAFKKKLAPYRGGWIWENQTIPIGSDTDNTPGSVGNQAGVPDTSHANREAFLMTTLSEMGLLFSPADLDRMARTLTDTLWNQSLADPMFANYLNGSDKPYRVYKQAGLNGSIYHGWALMGGYSPRAQEALIATLKAIVLGKHNPSLERNATSYGGRVGLAGHILRNFRPPRRA
ncbi:MAG: hypothetical protein NUW21_03935, partial [Elusimicrobia bacterium]|nr:hypothetical protein [Elusimicrobiota bacterium]